MAERLPVEEADGSMGDMTTTPLDDAPAAPQQARPRFGPPTTANPLWRAVLLAGGLFCLSCLMWITAGFADQRAPGNRWLNQNGMILVAVTGVASVASALGAMLIDSLQTRRMQQPLAEESAARSGGDRLRDAAANEESTSSPDPAGETCP